MDTYLSNKNIGIKMIILGKSFTLHKFCEKAKGHFSTLRHFLVCFVPNKGDPCSLGAIADHCITKAMLVMHEDHNITSMIAL